MRLLRENFSSRIYHSAKNSLYSPIESLLSCLLNSVLANIGVNFCLCGTSWFRMRDICPV